MTVSDDAWWELLHELDDPDHMEFPAIYDHTEVRARFNKVVAKLDTAFGCRCHVDRNIQDASFHGDIGVPATHTAGGERITIRISNFGNLAVYSPENIRSYTDAEKRQLLPAEDLDRIEDTLTGLDYRVVPEDLLNTRYNGRSDLANYYPSDQPPTWFTRFFDYL
ncbi:hypothetical protein [Actinomadura kijaniata]|uniref:hypothetical protein n=1 Tax=Actinomadura kijaniata TaxID=46161 RepID=UPI00083244DE|nr:hypothetical protein [Actinomadura kijaniata]